MEARWIEATYIPMHLAFKHRARINAPTHPRHGQEVSIISARQRNTIDNPTAMQYLVLASVGDQIQTLALEPKLIQVAIPPVPMGAQPQYRTPVELTIDWAPLAMPGEGMAEVRVNATQRICQPELRAVDGKMAKVSRFDSQAGFVFINHTELGFEFRVGYAQIELPTGFRSQRRVDALHNASPFDGYEAAKRQRVQQVQQAHAPSTPLDTFRPRDDEQRRATRGAGMTMQRVLLGGSGTGKTMIALYLAYTYVKACRAAGNPDARCLIITSTNHNQSRLQDEIQSLRVATYFDVRTRFEQLMLAQDDKPPADLDATVASMMRNIRRARAPVAGDQDSTKYALAYQSMARNDIYVCILHDEVNTEETTMPVLEDAIMRRFAFERGDEDQSREPFGGRCVLFTADIFQLAAMTHDRPLSERVVGNLYYKTDLIIHTHVITDLERHVLTFNYRQERAREHALLRDAMFGYASASFVGFLQRACMDEYRQRLYEKLLPSTGLEDPHRLQGNELPGIWCSHEQRHKAYAQRLTNYLVQNDLREGTDYLKIQAFRPGTIAAPNCTFNEAEKRALSRMLLFTLYLVPGLLYKVTKTATVALEMNVSMQSTIKSDSVLLLKKLEILPNTTAGSMPDFVAVFANLSNKASAAILITKSHFQTYEGRMRGADLMAPQGIRHNHVQACQLPLAGVDDETCNQWQGDKVTRAIGDGQAVWACGQLYVTIGRVVDLDQFYLLGRGRLFRIEGNGNVIWDENELHKIIEAHPAALTWWDEEGYFAAPERATYDGMLRSAYAKRVEYDRRSAATRGLHDHHGRQSDVH